MKLFIYKLFGIRKYPIHPSARFITPFSEGNAMFENSVLESKLPFGRTLSEKELVPGLKEFRENALHGFKRSFKINIPKKYLIFELAGVKLPVWFGITFAGVVFLLATLTFATFRNLEVKQARLQVVLAQQQLDRLAYQANKKIVETRFAGFERLPARNLDHQPQVAGEAIWAHLPSEFLRETVTEYKPAANRNFSYFQTGFASQLKTWESNLSGIVSRFGVLGKSVEKNNEHVWVGKYFSQNQLRATLGSSDYDGHITAVPSNHRYVEEIFTFSLISGGINITNSAYAFTHNVGRIRATYKNLSKYLYSNNNEKGVSFNPRPQEFRNSSNSRSSQYLHIESRQNFTHEAAMANFREFSDSKIQMQIKQGAEEIGICSRAFSGEEIRWLYSLGK